MVLLRWIGEPDTYYEGWPAKDHDEEDKDIAAEKIATGSYEPVKTPPAKAEVGHGR